MNIAKYSEWVHMARTHELASAYPPYERVPNILRYSFNNLFIIYPLISNGGISNAYSWPLHVWSTFNLAEIHIKVPFLTTDYHINTHAKLRLSWEMLTNVNARNVTLHQN